MNTKTLNINMDTKSKKDDEAAIFVLPPHLLQQLGINLESIDCTPNNPAIMEVKEDSTIKKSNNSESGNDKANESSILQTASLIRNTVLLSPTFIPTVANTIPGEVEIATINKKMENPDHCEENKNTEKSNDMRNAEKYVLPRKTKESHVDENILKHACNVSTTKIYNSNDLTNAGINNNLQTYTEDHYSNKNTEPAEQLSQANSNGLEKEEDDIFINDQHGKVYSSDSIDLDLNGSTETNIHNPLSDVTCSNTKSNNSLEHVKDEMSNDNIQKKVISPDCRNLEHNENFKSTNHHTLQSNITSSDLQKKKDDTMDNNFEQNFSKQIMESESLASTPVDKKYMISSKKKCGIDSLNTHETEENTEKYFDLASSLDPNVKINISDNNMKLMVIDKSSCSEIGSIIEGDFRLESNGNDKHSNEKVCNKKNVESYVTDSDNILVETILNNKKRLNITDARDIDSKDPSKIKNIEEVYRSNNNHEDSKESANTCEIDKQVNNVCKDIETVKVAIEKEIDKCTNKNVNEEYNSSEHFCKSDPDSNIIRINVNQYSQNECKKNSLDPVNSDCIVAEEKQKESILKIPCNNNLISLNGSKEGSIKSSVNTNIPVDKVEEIAECLSKLVNFYPNRKKTQMVQYNGKSLLIKPKRNVTETKLCIHGVEKPGGMQKTKGYKGLHMNLKTYKRQKLIQSNLSIANKELLSNKMLHKITTDSQYENDVNTVNLSHTFKTREFCVCGDFGQFSYYESTSLYEHIHFWNHKSIDCNLDIILSIYDDNYPDQINTTILCDEQLEDRTVDLCQHNICWYDLEVVEAPNFFDMSDHKTESVIINKSKEVDDFGVENQNKILSNQIVSLQQAELFTGRHQENNIHEIDFEANKRFQGNMTVSQINEQFLDDITGHNVSLKQTQIDKDIGDDNIYGTNELNSENPQFETRESNDFESPSQYIDQGETNTCVSNEARLICDTKINDNSKNNDSQIATLPHSIEIIEDDVKIQCDTRKSALTKDTNESRIKKADKEIISVSKQIEHSNNDITQKQNMSEETKKIAKKRKSQSTRGSTNKECTSELQCKKSIMCGVCDQLQSEDEWEGHIENEHCFIAWKADQIINLKDAELLQKLKQKLKTDGELKCTFCGNKNKFAKNFLSHVRKCLETKASSIESLVKCGVCKMEVKESCWMKHKAEHNYVAWKSTESSIEFEDDCELKEYLMKICKENGGLVCWKCGLNRKYVKIYMDHVKKCVGSKIRYDTSLSDTNVNTINDNEQETETGSSAGDEIVKCGVCQLNVRRSKWIKHIGNKHNYLAWVDGTPPLDIKNDFEVQKHLNNISKQHGGLNCSKCGMNRRYVKTYLQHMDVCGEYTTSYEEVNVTELEGVALSTIFDKSIFDVIDKNPQGSVKCGVCHAEIQSCDWLTHIQSQHNYKAWIQGQPMLDVNDVGLVRKYLNVISKRNGGLICQICGLKQKEAHYYLNHIETCKRNQEYDNANTAGPSLEFKVEIDISPIPVPQQETIKSCKGTSSKSEEYQCAICFTKVKPSAWDNHAMKKHYNLAWPVGDTPIDLKKPYVVERYLKEYKKHNKLVCKVCGISRASCVGFYAHILVCGKTEEEVNTFKEHCDICNNSYLCIYKSQHMTAHREAEYAKERKLKNEVEQVKKKTEETESPSGRRRAAEKARHVIEKYNTNLKEASHTCPSCNLGMDSKEELANHKCVAKYVGYSSDSDVSVKMEHCSDDDVDGDDDDLVNSDDDISNEEEEEEVVESKKKRHRESLPPPHKIPRIPFKVSDPEAYLRESSKDFYETHFTTEALFNEWRNCECESVPESELGQYMPPLEKSCKIKFGSDSWATYERFEAHHGWSLFVGACIQCISFAPPHLSDAADSCGHYLAVASHSGVDVPRYNYDLIAKHTNAIQIWNIGDFKSSLPKFVFGISHNYGTVWAMDWCPSGARDLLPQTETATEFRLGLLAVACSDGYAYIFSVPYPSTVTQKDNVFYKLKPAVELRATMNANRKMYQATSICWSPQKGHATVVVGYADGMVASFDLNCDSPILKSKVDSTTILYPYEDKRPHNSCITDVGVYPRARGEGATVGAVCSASTTGAGARVGAGRGGRGGRALSAHVAAARATFSPHWPAVLLAGDEYIVNLCVNELELSGAGRRLGTARAWAASARLGRVAAHSPPLLRLMRTHPAYRDLHKPVIGILQMIPIDRKRKRKIENDELAVTLEPTTYEAAIKKFGIEYTFIQSKDKAEQQKALSTGKERWLERFPLSDVSSMSFCHSEQHQDKLAVALHAGVIFIVKV